MNDVTLIYLVLQRKNLVEWQNQKIFFGFLRLCLLLLKLILFQ